MRRLAVAVVVLLLLAPVADRGAAALATRAVAAQAQETTALTSEPAVELTGFPFLTQALTGRYERVEVRARDVPAGELVLSRLDATLTGVQLPLADALRQRATGVPVESVTARAVVPYAELDRRSEDRELSVAPDGDRLRVTGELEVLGRTLSAVAVSSVEVVDGEIVVAAEEIEVGSRFGDALFTRALRGLLDISQPVDGLPAGMAVTDVEVQPSGLVVRASGSDVVLRR